MRELSDEVNAVHFQTHDLNGEREIEGLTHFTTQKEILLNKINRFEKGIGVV